MTKVIKHVNSCVAGNPVSGRIHRGHFPFLQNGKLRYTWLVNANLAGAGMSTKRDASLKFVTIGVYGSSEAGFFNALRHSGVDTFCDIRWRRGVRGSEYVFVNSSRLQRRLAELGIRYLHCRGLAPHPALRLCQDEADKAEGTTKRRRAALGQTFIRGYLEQNLAAFDSRSFIAQLGSDARTVALFCVEREPGACHRSLLAERLRRDLGVEVIHLLPDPPPSSKS